MEPPGCEHQTVEMYVIKWVKITVAGGWHECQECSWDGVHSCILYVLIAAD